MKVPEVKQCCCGCSLETGSTIIGWVDVVFSILLIVSAIIGLVTPSAQGHENSSTSLVIFLISGLFSLALSIILLIGVKRRLPGYVYLWVVITTIGLVLNILSTVVTGVLLMVNGVIGGGIVYILSGLLGAALGAYLIIVVYNFRRELLSENQHV